MERPSAALPTTRAFEDIDAGHADMDPLTRLQDVRKRMRTGRHKYAVPGWDADMSTSSSQESVLEQPPLPVDAPEQGEAEAAELVNLLRIRHARASMCGEQAATSLTKTPATVQPPLLTFSPPPTPGRDHGSVSLFTEFPKFLPLRSSNIQGGIDEDITTRATDKIHPWDTLALTEDGAPLPPAEIRLRLKPNFTLSLLQDLISSNQQSHTNCSNSGNSGNTSSESNVVPELPFQSDHCQSSSSNEKDIVKGSPMMLMARLPHRIREISRHLTAA